MTNPPVYVLYILKPPAICWLLRKPMRPKFRPIRQRRSPGPAIAGSVRRAPTFRHTRGLETVCLTFTMGLSYLPSQVHKAHSWLFRGSDFTLYRSGDIIIFQTRLNLTFCAKYFQSYHLVGTRPRYFEASTFRGLCTEFPPSRCYELVPSNNTTRPNTS